MAVVKNEEKITFNLSPSSLNIYYQSPLLFYLTYIAKVPDDTKVPLCYGLSGSIVHTCLEKYARKELDVDGVYLLFGKLWGQHQLHVHTDVKGDLLEPLDYLKAIIKGMHIIDQHDEYICEETIAFPLKENDMMRIGVKGIIDLQARNKQAGERVIIDYKTSNSVQHDKQFERQALFYNFLLHKHKQHIPTKTSFHYLKLGIEKEYRFDALDIKAFEEELHAIADELLAYGNCIDNYPIGDVDDLFNSKKQACLREVSRRTMLLSADYVMDAQL
ncbi:PD-(D/E)XK nuclease family protein [Candidatus Pacearchaeota archaeon]|nr:PD-(D/E)XK nuclease family protein [Candidatus Pacearchaeota archaeon]